MSRIYTVPFNGTVTAAGGDADLFSFQPADDKPIKLRGFILSQLTAVGDALEKGLRITVRRMTSTVTIGSGGNAITAAAPQDDSGGTVWGFTARSNDTTISTTTGTNQVVTDTCWNERNSPFDFWYPDVNFCPKARQTEVLILRLETTVAADMTASFLAFIEEE